jgi:transposase InsO family protein
MVSIALKTPNNIYILDEVKGEKCCMGQIIQIFLWHRRMGHINFDNLVKINKKQGVRDLPLIVKPSDPICKHCQHGNQTRVTFKTNEHSTSNPLQLIHIDLCGPTRTKILQGENYFMLLIDDYTRMTWVSFLKNKSEAIDKLKVFKELVENKTDLKINSLRSNNGGDFTSNEFGKLCEMHGIKRQLSKTRTQQQNGVV